MNNQDLISVIMSVHNGEKYLKEAIESILFQTYDHIEFIIINDGSTDSSHSIISNFKDIDNRIVFVDRPINKGLPFSLNEAIALSKGRYIARMDADDIAHEDRFEKQLNYFKSRPEVDILGGQVALIDSNRDIVKCSDKPLSYSKIRSSAEFSCPVNHPTYMVKKKIYNKLNGYREYFVYAQDYDFILRAIDAGFIIENTEDILLSYRSFPNMHSITKRHRQLYLARHALILHKERVRFGLESSKTIMKLSRKSFSAKTLFIFSWKLRQKALRNKLPKMFYYLLVILPSMLHFEVFNASLRGFLYARSKK